MKVLLCHPGASWSTADVEAGLRYGLKHHGVTVVPYRLDQRLEFSREWLQIMWREKSKDDPALPAPNNADAWYHASVGALEMAMRHNVHVVLIVSAMFMHPDVILMMKRAGLFVTVLFTESPYNQEGELRVARMVDGCWTNERTSVAKFRTVNARAGYLAHAWHPERHFLSARQVGDLPAHDVVFVGTGFPERIEWFNSIDWTGIDLGLYGTWDDLGLNDQVMACVRGPQVRNEMAASLYRRAKIGLNLYRTSRIFGDDGTRNVPPESLSPRAYELAACGSFSLSSDRAEVREVFGDCVPTFTSATEARDLIRYWLDHDSERVALAAQLPACVAGASWTERATTVIGDLETMLAQRAA